VAGEVAGLPEGFDLGWLAGLCVLRDRRGAVQAIAC